MRGATKFVHKSAKFCHTSIHAPHAWGDKPIRSGFSPLMYFNPRPTCVGRLNRRPTQLGCQYTSIHAPHAWGDLREPTKETILLYTSIHAPHAWGDEITAEGGNRTYNFNPRPTCVGRLHSYLNIIYATDFNPRPTCVGRLNVFKAVFNLLKLQSTPHMRGATGMRSCKSQTAQTSIHAPHAWGDQTAQHRK